MKQILLSAYIVIMVLLLSACVRGGKTSSALSNGDTLVFRHAINLSIVEYPEYTVAKLRNPWDTLSVLHTYILTDKRKPLPDHLPEGTVIGVPLENCWFIRLFMAAY